MLPLPVTPLDVDAVTGRLWDADVAASEFVVVGVASRSTAEAVWALGATGLVGRVIPRRIAAASISALLWSNAMRCSRVY